MPILALLPISFNYENPRIKVLVFKYTQDTPIGKTDSKLSQGLIA